MIESPKHDLTTGPVGAHLRRQRTPFAFGLVAIFSFDAADMFFISRLGEAPLAAVAFALPLIWLTYGIGIGLEAGAASCVSRAVGRGDRALFGHHPPALPVPAPRSNDRAHWPD